MIFVAVIKTVLSAKEQAGNGEKSAQYNNDQFNVHLNNSYFF